MITTAISLFFAGLWPLVWHFGFGFGFVIIGVAIWWFTPLKQTGLAIAIIAGAATIGYGIGVKDELARCNTKAAVVQKRVDALVRAARKPSIRRLPDRWDDPRS